jgi:hypothetical protein
MAIRKALIKVQDPKAGPSYQEYVDICKALGVKPQPPKKTQETKS